MDDVAIARALHILAVVIWIGGVSMVTTVALPAIRRGDLGGDWLRALGAIEHRFAWQARIAVVIVGLTGFYMSARLDLWDRFRSAQFWWMHAMVGVGRCLLSACSWPSHSSSTAASVDGRLPGPTGLLHGCRSPIGRCLR